MKIAVIDNENTIWGIGNTYGEAFQDAFKCLRDASNDCNGNAGDYDMTYDEFSVSKIFDRYKTPYITDDAEIIVAEYGGLWDDICDKLVVSNEHGSNVIMTAEEYREKYGER